MAEVVAGSGLDAPAERLVERDRVDRRVEQERRAAVRARLASVSLDRLEIDLELVSLSSPRSGGIFVQGRADAPRTARKAQRQTTRKTTGKGVARSGSSRPGNRPKTSTGKGGGKPGAKRRGR